MISLRGLTDHTLKNYCTYIRAYLDYLSTCLHKLPEDVSWPELRDYIRWLQIRHGINKDGNLLFGRDKGKIFVKSAHRKLGIIPRLVKDIQGKKAQL